MNIFDFYQKKKNNEKISMITCYDYTSARMLSSTAVDCLLVGDSLAMTMHGYKDTLSATLNMMALHTQAVHRGAQNKFIITDLPFLSYRKSLSKNVSAAECLMRAGANAVKLESASGNIKLIRHFVESGIPVMGHLGLTTQLIHMLGGFKVQGREKISAEKIKADAMALQDAGCFSVVLECIPNDLARAITTSLHIPTIGIGAGPHTDGQVLVYQDLLGLNIDFKPKFVKTFVDGHQHVANAVETFIHAIKTGAFPQHEHCYEN